jgi:hypothetical protein
MHLIDLFQKEIISLISALILAGILYLFRARAKLVWATAHGFTFLLPTASVASPQSPGQQTTLPANVPPNFNIHTGSLIVLNTGRIPATEVEVTFNWQPPNYNIWPVRPHDTYTSPDNRFTLKFANLAPKEQFLVEQISPQPLPQIMSVRCKECVGKAINMRPTVVFPGWFIALLWGLIFLGATSVIYLLLKVGSLLIYSGQ